MSGRLPRTRLILSSLERSYEHAEPIEMTNSITIEHVMPQTLSPLWEEALGEDAARIHEELLHTIGNITYSGSNSEMGNAPFESKREVLATSHFEMNRAIVQAQVWTEAEIRARAETLAEQAVHIWKGPSVEVIYLT